MESKEALEKICLHCEHYHQDMCFRAIAGCEEWHKLEKDLERLEQIDIANPSEALKDLQVIENNFTYILSDCDINDEVCQDLKYAKTKILPIRQALLKVQEQEKILEKYKSIEEELGCSLEVIFKALNDGIYQEELYFPNVKNHLDAKYLRLRIWYNQLEWTDIWNGCNVYEFELKDYKKTWWLKEDKSE